MSSRRPHGLTTRLKKAWEPPTAERAGHLRLVDGHLLVATLGSDNLVLELCNAHEGITHTISVDKHVTAPFIHWDHGLIVVRYAGGMCRCHVEAEVGDVFAFFASLPREFVVFDRGYGRAA